MAKRMAVCTFSVRETTDGLNQQLAELAIEHLEARPKIYELNGSTMYAFEDPAEAAAIAFELVKRGVAFDFSAPHSHREGAAVQEAQDYSTSLQS